MQELLRNWDVLDLTSAERKTLSGLIEGGPMSVSETARRVGVARTTVDAALRRLHERKLVRKAAGRPRRASGRAQFWTAVEITDAQTELADAIVPFQRGEGGGTPVLPASTPGRGGVSVFQGKKGVLSAYKKLVKRAGEGPVLFIQGNRAARAVSEREDRRYMLSIQDELRRSGAAVEGISGLFIEDFLNHLPLEELQKHLNRLVHSTLVPDELMDFDLEIVLLRDCALLLDPDTETVVLIQNPSIRKFFEKVSRLMQKQGRSVDLNAQARTRIVEELRKG